MKISKGQTKVRLPQLHEILAVRISDAAFSYPLCFVPLTTLQRMRQDHPAALGRPTICTLVSSINQQDGVPVMEIYPAPDRGMVLKVRYTPPEKEV